MLNFTKMNGAGNDFIMVDNRQQTLHFTNAQIARLCDRHRGIGADGLLAVEPSQHGADVRMRYYNADGGEVEMCGNGARCFARYVQKIIGGGGRPSLSFETQAGQLSASYEGELVRLAMSNPHSLALNARLPVADTTLDVHFINTGVPHAIVIVDDLENTPIVKWGAALRYHEHFAPKGTNANFMKVLRPNHIAIRTYERGVEDETLACGTGMVASALVHHLLHGATGPVSVDVRGGDTLHIGFTASGHEFTDVTLTGPADFVFDGQVSV